MTQERYTSLIQSGETTPVAMLKALNGAIAGHPVLAQFSANRSVTPRSRPRGREPFIPSDRTVALRLRVGLALALVLVSGPAWANEAGDDAYLNELIRQATDARLSQQRYWHLLLHYRRDLTGGHTSEV